MMYDVSMIVTCKTFFRAQLVSLAACLALLAQPSARAEPVDGWASLEQAINTHMRVGEYVTAERLVRTELDKLGREMEGRQSPGSAQTTFAGGKDQTPRQKLQSVLAMILGARAFEADQRQIGTKLTGSDVVMLMAVMLLASGLLLAILRYGPLRPKFIDDTTRWLGKIKHETNEDSMKQCTSVLYTLGIFALSGGAIFLFLYGTIHLVANLESKENSHSKEARVLFDEAKTLMAESTPSHNAVEDYDVLNLYSKFLRRMGEHDLASAVMRRAITLQKQTVRCGRTKQSS